MPGIRQSYALTNGVFDEQIPPDDERYEFADSHVTVNVRGPGPGHSARKFGVTHT